jgi:hypothetical protein
MEMTPRWATGSIAVGLAWLCLGLGCSAGRRAAVEPRATTKEKVAAAADDEASGCEYKDRADREVAESVGTGAIQPSIRRVYRLVGEADQRRRILVCREVDTNLDGVKDIVRRYSDWGEPVEEQVDSDYDGRSDTWIRFSKGHMGQVLVDLDRDGNADETRYYVDGKLSRVQRDTNHDGKPDVWEIYARGHLERMGVDVDFDGRVDRWNRDSVAAKNAREAGEASSRRSDPASASDSEGRAAGSEGSAAP